MRIRKHAKISPLLYASSSLKPGTLVQTHVCQLNQSPWDVMTFSPPSSPPPPPPPPSQANGSGAHVRNGSSDCFLSVAERELSYRRRSEYGDAATHKAEVEEDTAPPPPPPPAKINEGTIMCCKTDGKSWQCRREAAEGNSLCEHHLSLIKSYSSVAHHAAKKSVKPAVETQRRTRPKKDPASSSSNPYEFYYYAGFGPRWGKRRGETRKNSINGSSMPKNLGDAKVEDQQAPAASYIDFDFDEYEDEDEDEEENRDNGKKRMRKPIKARSLKSLL